MSLSHEEAIYVKHAARESGFDLVGIAPAEPIPEATAAFQEWLAQNFDGDMTWIRRDPRRRTDPRVVLPGAQSVICLAINYFPGNHPELPPQAGKVARYAWGRDYHDVLEAKAASYARALGEKFPADTFRYYVDHGPILERAYAARAGLGYLGKNACLITMKYGSWVLLSVMITTRALASDVPETRIRCGTCTRCMRACPTSAIVSPGIIDARKCISYQTIEKRGRAIDVPVATQIAPWVLGCDVCQEVCPHNVRAQVTTHTEFHAASGNGPVITRADLDILQSEDDFQQRYSGTPITRATLAGVRNTMDAAGL